jgi:hypothetical protein
MKLDDVLEVYVEMEINENILVLKDIVNRLGRMPWDMAKKFLRQKALELATFVKNDPYIDESNVLRIINTRLGTTFSSINTITSKALVENSEKLDESLKTWWKEAATNMYGALSFYPLLTAFLEFDKIIKNSGEANVRAMVIYFLIWVLIITGKVVMGTIGKPGEEKEGLDPSLFIKPLTPEECFKDEKEEKNNATTNQEETHDTGCCNEDKV